MSTGKYDDIIDLPHYEPKKHPRMSMQSRAAQFSPFAALTGYGDEIKETGRLTSARSDLEEEDKLAINEKLRFISDHLKEYPVIEITHFVPDARKDGGEYVTVTGTVKKIDTYTHTVILTTGEKISVDNIYDIDGEVFVFDEYGG